jgi:hypothetical protein
MWEKSKKKKHLRQAIIQAYLHFGMLSIIPTMSDFKKIWRNSSVYMTCSDPFYSRYTVPELGEDNSAYGWENRNIDAVTSNIA